MATSKKKVTKKAPAAKTKTKKSAPRVASKGHGVTMAMLLKGKLFPTPAKAKAPPPPVREKVAKASTPRGESKQAKLVEMLKRPEGASLDEIMEAFGWQAHTVRGAIAGALKKKLGLDVKSADDEKRGRVYSISA